MDKNRVVWHEGLFLRPQHLQQQERFLQDWGEQRTSGLRSFSWGITVLELDESLLSLGKVALAKCQGVFPDGTPFDIPGQTPAPAPIDIDEEMKDCRLYLAVPLVQPDYELMSDDIDEEKLIRHHIHDLEVKDVHTRGINSREELQIGKLNLSILAEGQKLDAYAVLPFAQVIEKDNNDTVKLDKNFIPTVMHCEASSVLASCINEVEGLLRHRGKAIAGRGIGVDSVNDFLLLQLVNRHEPLMTHLKGVKGLFPEELFRVLVSLAGELATFTRDSKRPVELPDYHHLDQQQSFEPVMDEIRRALSKVIEPNAIPIDIKEHKYGVWVAVIPDKSLLDSASFVLAVKGQVNSETIRSKFPNTVTIATVEKIRELVNAQVEGIEITPLPAVPRQIPYHAGFTYFEINTRHKYWKLLATAGGLAVHVGAVFDGLEMELWAIRSS